MSQLRRWVHHHDWRVVGLTLAVVGLVLRVWILNEPLGAVDSDEGVVGLMARHFLQGEFPAFYWGQPHGGSLEALMTAPLTALTGASIVTLKLVPLVLHLVAGYLVWMIGRELLERRVALIASALFWAAPAVFIYRSTQAYAFYASGLVLGLATVLLILRLSKAIVNRNIWLLGLVLGIGWWTSLQIVPLVFPALLWLLFRNREFRRRVFMTVPGFIVGALPWILNNLANDWHSLRVPSVGPADVGYLDRLNNFFTGSVPMLFGLRLPISGELVVPERLGTLASLAVIGACMWIVWNACIWIGWKLGGAGEFLAVIVAMYPFIYAASPFTWYFGDARYIYFLWPVIALLLVAALFRLSRPIAFAAVLGLTAVTCAQVVIANQQEGARIGTSNALPRTDLSPAPFLEELGIRHVFTSYWIAYKVTFESEERVIAASMNHVRYEPYQQEVRAADRPAYLFVRGTDAVANLGRALESRGIGFDEYQTGAWAVIVPAEKVLPEHIPEVTTG